MTTYFVTRHPGAVAWATQHGIAVDSTVAHLDPATIQPGDRVLGNLPIQLAAVICQRGGRFFNLSLDVPVELRGQELSATDLQRCNARLEEFTVHATGESLGS